MRIIYIGIGELRESMVSSFKESVLLCIRWTHKPLSSLWFSLQATTMVMVSMLMSVPPPARHSVMITVALSLNRKQKWLLLFISLG